MQKKAHDLESLGQPKSGRTAQNTQKRAHRLAQKLLFGIASLIKLPFRDPTTTTKKTALLST